MKEQRKLQRRKVKRRKLLNESEFRKLIETGKVIKHDRRSWKERRKRNRRKAT